MLRLRSTATILTAVAMVLRLTTLSAQAVGERLAVLVVVDQDPELSDNLTVVAISKLAERRDRRLVGWRELHAQLSDVLEGKRISDCLERSECLSRVGAAARAGAALIGDVRRLGDQFAVRMVLVNTNSGVRDAEFSETVTGDLPAVISAVRKGADIAYTPKQATVRLEVPLRPIGETAAIPATRAPPLAAVEPAPRRARWAGPLGYVTGGLAVVSLSAAVVTGSLATANPAGSTRAEAQTDLDRRDEYARIANGLYLAAGALAASAVVLLLSQLRHL
jgi:hypothetical protein